ncbi:MAG: GtrA family protein [Oscillospiraceae bacterium]|nr:GtrA family protein [Oscillospiraceae bacterium]
MENKMSKKENIIQVIKFACFSASAGVIEVISFTLLNELLPNTESANAIAQWFFNSEYGAAYLVALILSVLWNFTFNRKFTFKSAANVPAAMAKVFAFYIVFTPVTTILGEVAAKHFTWKFSEYVILAVTMLSNMILEYLYNRFVVYKDTMNTNNLANKEKENAAK